MGSRHKAHAHCIPLQPPVLLLPSHSGCAERGWGLRGWVGLGAASPTLIPRAAGGLSALLPFEAPARPSAL